MQSVSDCDLNPLTRNHLASPVAVTGIKTMALKMVMVVVSTTCTELGKAQSVIMLICTAVITYYLLTTVRASPCCSWCEITYSEGLLHVAVRYGLPSCCCKP